MAAAQLGFQSYGYDLNPVMFLVARSRTLDTRTYCDLPKYIANLIARAKGTSTDIATDDPLHTWLQPRSAAVFRNLDRAIQQLQVGSRRDDCFRNLDALTTLSSLAAFCYTALFRTIRLILKPFIASNPTWIKRSISPCARLDVLPDAIFAALQAQVAAMIAAGGLDGSDTGTAWTEPVLEIASSDAIPLPTASIDAVLTSPP